MSFALIVFLSTAAQTAPDGWTCDAAFFADDTCDCGCGVADEDCASATADACERDNCPEGQVAWQEHNESCMDAAAGCASSGAVGGAFGGALALLLAARRRRALR